MRKVLVLYSAKSQGQGYFTGPKGGKWADAEHTIPWKPQKRPIRVRVAAMASNAKRSVSTFFSDPSYRKEVMTELRGRSGPFKAGIKAMGKDFTHFSKTMLELGSQLGTGKTPPPPTKEDLKQAGSTVVDAFKAATLGFLYTKFWWAFGMTEVLMASSHIVNHLFGTDFSWFPKSYQEGVSQHMQDTGPVFDEPSYADPKTLNKSVGVKGLDAVIEAAFERCLDYVENPPKDVIEAMLKKDSGPLNKSLLEKAQKKSNFQEAAAKVVTRKGKAKGKKPEPLPTSSKERPHKAYMRRNKSGKVSFIRQKGNPPPKVTWDQENPWDKEEMPRDHKLYELLKNTKNVAEVSEVMASYADEFWDKDWGGLTPGRAELNALVTQVWDAYKDRDYVEATDEPHIQFIHWSDDNPFEGSEEYAEATRYYEDVFNAVAGAKDFDDFHTKLSAYMEKIGIGYDTPEDDDDHINEMFWFFKREGALKTKDEMQQLTFKEAGATESKKRPDDKKRESARRSAVGRGYASSSALFKFPKAAAQIAMSGDSGETPDDKQKRAKSYEKLFAASGKVNSFLKHMEKRFPKDFKRDRVDPRYEPFSAIKELANRFGFAMAEGKAGEGQLTFERGSPVSKEVKAVIEGHPTIKQELGGNATPVDLLEYLDNIDWHEVERDQATARKHIGEFTTAIADSLGAEHAARYSVSAGELREAAKPREGEDKPPNVFIEPDTGGTGFSVKVDRPSFGGRKQDQIPSFEARMSAEEILVFLGQMQNEERSPIEDHQPIGGEWRSALSRVYVDPKAMDRLNPLEPSAVTQARYVLTGGVIGNWNSAGQLIGSNPLKGRTVKTSEGFKLELSGKSRRPPNSPEDNLTQSDWEYHGTVIDGDQKRSVWVPMGTIEQVIKSIVRDNL